MIPVEAVGTVGPRGRLPKPLFDCIEGRLLEEVRERRNGYSCSGRTLIYRLYGWRITDAGQRALKPLVTKESSP